VSSLSWFLGRCVSTARLIGKKLSKWEYATTGYARMCTKVLLSSHNLPMQQDRDHDYDTNLGWWTDKPDREVRPTSLGPIYGPYRRRRKGRVWFKAALIVALMTAFGWSLLHLAGLPS
jgi:hypothetical protein